MASKWYIPLIYHLTDKNLSMVRSKHHWTAYEQEALGFKQWGLNSTDHSLQMAFSNIFSKIIVFFLLPYSLNMFCQCTVQNTKALIKCMVWHRGHYWRQYAYILATYMCIIMTKCDCNNYIINEWDKTIQYFNVGGYIISSKLQKWFFLERHWGVIFHFHISYERMVVIHDLHCTFWLYLYHWLDRISKSLQNAFREYQFSSPHPWGRL